MWSWLRSALPDFVWGAGPEGIDFHEVFLDRVVRVPEIQQQRELVTALGWPWRDLVFFEDGSLPGDDTSMRFRWSADPDNPQLLFLLGVQLWFDGNRDEARPLFAKAARLATDPATAEAFGKIRE